MSLGECVARRGRWLNHGERQVVSEGVAVGVGAQAQERKEHGGPSVVTVLTYRQSQQYGSRRQSMWDVPRPEVVRP